MSDVKQAFAINHIGINVPDLEAAVDWYVSVLGFEVVHPVIEVVAGEGEAGTRFAQMNGPAFRKGRVATLATGNGVGFEMFEFLDPRTEPFEDDWQFWRPGTWHFCITTPAVGRLAASIAARGGRHRTPVLETSPGSGFVMTFCQDPWGNPIELMSASYDRIAQASA